MATAEPLKVLRKRVALLITGLAITIGGVSLIGITGKPTYSSTSAVVIVPSTAAAPIEPGAAAKPPTAGNPFLALDPSLRVVAEVVSNILRDQKVQAALRSAGATATFNATLDAEQNSPIVIVGAESPQKEEADKTVTIVVSQISTELNKLQESSNAPAGTWLRALPISHGPATASYKAVIQKAGIVGAGGLLLTLCLVFLVERRAQHAASSTPTEELSGGTDLMEGSHLRDNDVEMKAVSPTFDGMESRPEPRPDDTQTVRDGTRWDSSDTRAGRHR
jgi:hypothetical protein